MIFFKAEKYHKMSDAQLEAEASRWGIREYGNRNGTISRSIIIQQLLAKDGAKNSEVAKFLSVIALAIAIGGFFLSIYVNQKQIEGIENELNSKEIDYVLRFDDRFNSGNNYRISVAIEKKRALLKENGGQFTIEDLDLFLGLYNELSDAYDKNLISKEILYGNFSDGLIKAYRNKEIQTYLKKIRVEDDSYFMGFDNLATTLSEEE